MSSTTAYYPCTNPECDTPVAEITRYFAGNRSGGYCTPCRRQLAPDSPFYKAPVKPSTLPRRSPAQMAVSRAAQAEAKLARVQDVVNAIESEYAVLVARYNGMFGEKRQSAEGKYLLGAIESKRRKLNDYVATRDKLRAEAFRLRMESDLMAENLAKV